MKMVKKTGLVPVLSRKTGTVFGVKPAIARAMLAAKECELVEIPEGIETVVLSAPPVAKQTEAPAADLVPIPEDWATMHRLKQIALAKALKADYAVPEGRKPLEYALEVIGEEVQRRAAVDPAPAE